MDAMNRPLRRGLITLGLLFMQAAALAQTDPPPPAPAAARAAAPAAAPAASAPATVAAPAPAALRPFREIVREARERKGFFTLHQKDEKVWLEIRPEQFGKPFFFSWNVASSVGERGLYASQMGRSHQAEFRRIGNQVQLIARNTAFQAAPGTPNAQSVAQGFSESLLASAPVLSSPQRDTRAILVDAASLLFTDIAGYSTRLESAYRLHYTVDRANTSFARVDVDEALTGLLVNTHFSVPRIAAAPITPPSTPMPSPPTTTPDARSLFVGFYFNFVPLPEQPMRPRLADDRLGHFVTTAQDYSDDTRADAARHYVRRWRLEKREPAAAMSDPVKPIVFWLDRNIPLKYRESVTQGVLEWNKAFERIGFRNAIVARQQQQGDDFDTLDARHASVRWFMGADVGFAIGPSRVDARSGEILDADIGMSDAFAKNARRTVAEDLLAAHAHSPQDGQGAECHFAAEAAMEMDFAFELLAARGELDMASPQAEAVAQAYVRSIIIHEVGHALGLRHNFRASTIYSLQQLQDKAFTQANGLTGSIMDYVPFNLAAKGEPQAEYVMSTIGPYDYWAIEYAYAPLDEATEKQALALIASRSTDPLLAYGSDEDASAMQVADPDVNTFDLGSDPLLYVDKRLALSRELWDRLQTRQLKAGDSYESLRRSFESGFSQYRRALPVAVKFVGGTTFLRDRAGTGRATFTPVPVQRQRQALKLVSDSLFTAKSFVFSPELVSRLGVDHFGGDRTDVSVSARLLSLQTYALDRLMSDVVAHRIVNSREKLRRPEDALSLHELYASLQSAVWSELEKGGDIPLARRNLQREHLKRLANVLVRPGAQTSADARSLQREKATQLLAGIGRVLGRPSSRALSHEARAHLLESQATLVEVLKAPLVRSSV